MSQPVDESLLVVRRVAVISTCTSGGLFCIWSAAVGVYLTAQAVQGDFSPWTASPGWFGIAVAIIVILTGFLGLVAAVGVGIFAFRRTRAGFASSACPACMFPIRTNVGICPECGAPVDSAAVDALQARAQAFLVADRTMGRWALSGLSALLAIGSIFFLARGMIMSAPDRHTWIVMVIAAVLGSFSILALRAAKRRCARQGWNLREYLSAPW